MVPAIAGKAPHAHECVSFLIEESVDEVLRNVFRKRRQLFRPDSIFRRPINFLAEKKTKLSLRNRLGLVASAGSKLQTDATKVRAATTALKSL